MGNIYELTDPTLTMDIGGQCQVSVISSSHGTVLRFDGPNGELKFRISDDEWKKIQDAVWLARNSRGIFDGDRCADCGKPQDKCDGTKGVK